jgi:type IV pilus assembly protein PilE
MRIAGTKSRGFTLLELMIVIAIIAILASIAYPSYIQYIERARRNDAKAVLLEAAQYMERRFTENRTYATTTALPTSLQQSPREGAAWYTISPGTPTATGYTLTATPRSGWTPRECGTLSVNQLGVRASSANTVDLCWGK